MKTLLVRIASLKITLLGIGGMIALALATYRNPGFGTVWLAVPLAVLAVNLLAAILTNGAFRQQSALLVFHVCLLAVILLIGAELMIRFGGHVEVVEGESFDAQAVEIMQQGAWHRLGLDQVNFVQGRITVDYRPGLIRHKTRSNVTEVGTNGRTREVGDGNSVTFGSYRFSTTFNKGWAVILRWSGDNGIVQRGSINFPSFPEFEWKQANDWTTPNGEQVALELRLDPVSADTNWVLRSGESEFSVVINDARPDRHELKLGDSIRMQHGTLTIEDLRLWMGYRIDFNPLLPWVFAAAMLALVALAAHFQLKFRTAVPASRTAKIGAMYVCD
jgi:cytochrome c biogenesis protein